MTGPLPFVRASRKLVNLGPSKLICSVIEPGPDDPWLLSPSIDIRLAAKGTEAL
jgi:hypothetical protein